MADYLRYLVTVDPRTREIVKAQELGEAGDLRDVDPGELGLGRRSPESESRVFNLNFYFGDQRGPGLQVEGNPDQSSFRVSDDIPGGSNLGHRVRPDEDD